MYRLPPINLNFLKRWRRQMAEEIIQIVPSEGNVGDEVEIILQDQPSCTSVSLFFAGQILGVEAVAAPNPDAVANMSSISTNVPVGAETGKVHVIFETQAGAQVDLTSPGDFVVKTSARPLPGAPLDDPAISTISMSQSPTGILVTMLGTNLQKVQSIALQPQPRGFNMIRPLFKGENRLGFVLPNATAAGTYSIRLTTLDSKVVTPNRRLRIAPPAPVS
jgi:hypothetical protein